MRSRFLRLLWGFNPLLRPKVPHSYPYGLIPLSLCITLANNQNTDIDVNLVHFFLFFYFFIFFFIFLGLFLASFDPYSGSHWAQGPHMDHNPEVYYISIESAKKWTLIIDCVHFFLFHIMVIFSHTVPLGGSLGGPRYAWGPKVPISCLTSVAILYPGAIASSIGQIFGFFGNAIKIQQKSTFSFKNNYKKKSYGQSIHSGVF